MVDYDQILSRTTAVLPQTRPETRRAIYGQLRGTLASRLRTIKPTAAESEIAEEQRALEEAIARVEKKFEAEAAPPSGQIGNQRTDQIGAKGWIGELLARASREEAPPAPSAEWAPAVEKMPVIATSLRPSVAKSGAEIKEQTAGMENIENILMKLQRESAGIEASALISEGGTMIASSLTPDIGTKRVAGMAATLQNLGGRAAVELTRGNAREVIVRGDRGYAIMINAGRGALLLALANDACKLGLVFFDMLEAVKALEVALVDYKMLNKDVVDMKSLSRAVRA